jgi:hypothetical protein
MRVIRTATMLIHERKLQAKEHFPVAQNAGNAALFLSLANKILTVEEIDKAPENELALGIFIYAPLGGVFFHPFIDGQMLSEEASNSLFREQAA